MDTVVLAIGCHPDDIEFMMGGTLFLLREAGCTIHYMNIANGSCGTAHYGPRKIAKTRKREAQEAASYLGASYHKSLVKDLEVFYTQPLIRRVTALIRKVMPDILLIPSPEDYMEDHMNTSRISVSAALYKGMRNYRSIPRVKPIYKNIVLYHALAYGPTDGLKRPVQPDFYVDITTVIDQKEQMLAFHKSQQEWLDKSQGYNSYLKAMREMSREAGRLSGVFQFAEGWRGHAFLGFSVKEMNPLFDILKPYVGRKGEVS